jgi:hypothetical protein
MNERPPDTPQDTCHASVVRICMLQELIPRYFQDSGHASVVRICIGWNKQNVRSESDQKYN